MVITVSSVDQSIGEKLKSFFPGKNVLIAANPGGVILPQKFQEISESIEKFAVREDDVWLVSYPRTGSTWAQEMVWLLGSKLNFEVAKDTMLAMRSPMLELTALFSEDNHEWIARSMSNSVDILDKVPSPRFARSHLTWDLLPRQIHEVKPKIIYTARNPKDLCVSYYHYCKLLHSMEGTLDDFCELFMAGGVPIGSYWNHVLKFWEHRNDDNIHFIKYETMKRNLPAVIRKCAEFLELDYSLTDGDLDRICDHLQFNKMQKNPAVNLEVVIKQDDDPKSNAKFIRKGEIGDWKNHITPEMSRKFDEWIEANTRGTGLEFEYE